LRRSPGDVSQRGGGWWCVLMKPQARDRTQLVVIAYETGLLTPGGG
jgi:hypothetical protein